MKSPVDDEIIVSVANVPTVALSKVAFPETVRSPPNDKLPDSCVSPVTLREDKLDIHVTYKVVM